MKAIPLTDLPRAMKAAGYTPATYRAFYLAALDDRIPAEKNDKGRWGVSPEDLPVIASAMSLAPQSAHAA